MSTALPKKTLPDGVHGVAYSQALTASGGGGGYVWVLVSGSLPTGLDLAKNGHITGTPAVAGTSEFTVKVRSRDGWTRLLVSITVKAAPELARARTTTLPNKTLPDGVDGVAYSQALAASGGGGGYVWVLASGSLPVGLKLAENGHITGTPTVPGTSEFTVQVTSRGGRARLAVALTVNAALVVTTRAVPDGIEDVAYSQALAASGGGGGYVWALVSGSLPAGLNLAENGHITGTPTVPGTSEFTVQVTSRGGRARLAVALTVNAALAVMTRAVPDGVENVAYGRSLVASGGAGRSAWELAPDSGPLPMGLDLASNGDITGTPTEPGTSRFAVQVTSGDGQTAQVALAITVKAAPQASAAPQARATPTVGPAVRRAGLVLLSLGIAAGVWIPSVRAFFPVDAFAAWFEDFAVGRASVYAALYPMFYLIFVLLCPVVVLAAGVQSIISRVAAAVSQPTRETPSSLRAQAREYLRRPSNFVSPRARLRGALAAQLGLISALHLVGLVLPGTSDRVGLILGLTACVLAIWVWRWGSAWELTLLGLMGAAQAATFAVVLMEAPLPFAYRPLLVLTASFYLAVPVLLVGMLLPRPRVRAFIMLAVSLVGGALLVETGGSWLLSRRGEAPTLDAAQPASVAIHRGPLEQHPEMGPIPVPGSVTETLYPDDPRGYFGVRSPSWRLGVLPSSDARLELASDEIRVLIERADDATPWHIQLSRSGLKLVGGTEYLMGFRVRATQEREYRFGVIRALPPRESLGLFGVASAGGEWTGVQRTFTATQSDDSVQVVFEFGGDAADVYLSDLSLAQSDGRGIGNQLGVEHYVSYEWNSRGCRAPEYPIPPRPEAFRVLALGGSYAMGEGVHVEDVFTSVVERLLREQASQTSDARRFEVVGCGVRGFSPREERLYYDERVSAYQPDLVLVVMVADDARTFTDDELLGFVHTPAKWEHLLRTGYLVQAIRHARPEPDFSASTAELAALHERVTEDGAELALVVFTNGVGPAWDRLSASAASTAQALGIPILDLGDQLLSEEAPADLMVHPFDGHPNEIAHRIAGERIVDWLGREGLIGPSP